MTCDSLYLPADATGERFYFVKTALNNSWFTFISEESCWWSHKKKTGGIFGCLRFVNKSFLFLDVAAVCLMMSPEISALRNYLYPLMKRTLLNCHTSAAWRKVWFVSHLQFQDFVSDCSCFAASSITTPEMIWFFFLSQNEVKTTSDEQHTTCYTESLFTEQKLRQNTEALCGKTKWTPWSSSS